MIMRISAVTVTAGLAIVLSLFACAIPAPPQSGVAAPPIRTAAVCSVSTFLSKVVYLQQTMPPFSLPDSGFAKQPPVDTEQRMNNPIIIQDLTQAFNAAPDFFKNQLCSLTKIYIDRTGCSTSTYDPSTCTVTPAEALWAFRAFDGTGKSAGEFIGTWLGFWQQGHVPVLSQFEKLRVQNLLNWTSSNPPVVDLANPDTSAMTMLAVLAHEVGHIFWYDAFVVKANGDANPGGDTDFSHFCSGKFYTPVVTPGGIPEGSWLTPPTVSTTRWVSFGDPRNYHKTDDVDMTKLVVDLNRRRPNYPEAGDLLHAVYSGQQLDGKNSQNGRWASALAAFSTDEDFVETFQLFVLMHAQTQAQVSGPLQNLRVIIYGSQKNVAGQIVPYEDDVPASFNSKPELMRKSACFSSLIP
jgi:hypothetical protein